MMERRVPGCKEMVNINFKMWLCTSKVFQNLRDIYIFLNWKVYCEVKKKKKIIIIIIIIITLK